MTSSSALLRIITRIYSVAYVTKHFARAVRHAGLPPLRLHDTRHWHATAMLRAGVDVKVVAGRLGHSSTRITQDVYQHRVEQLDRAAAEKVAGLIFEAGGPAGS